MAKGDVRGVIENAETVVPPDDPGPAPFRALGFHDGTYFLFSRVGEFRLFRFGQLTWLGLVSLLDGDLTWAEQRFPMYGGGRSAERKEGTFDVPALQRYVVRCCAGAGKWNDSTPVRRTGVWLCDDGRLVVHTGNRLLETAADPGGAFAFTEKPAGQVYDGKVYPLEPSAAPPALVPAGADVGERLRSYFGLWRWESPLGPDLATGFVGQAMLGGAPRWRAHVMLTGPAGCGKTEVTDNLLAGVLGGGAHPVKTGYTEAYLRQAMSETALALVLDEAEHDEHGRAIATVVRLLVQMSSGAGARVGRGSAEGRAQRFSVTGAAWLSSVLHADLTPQARSRILLLRLRKLRAGKGQGEAKARVEAAVVDMTEQSAALRARAIVGWPRYQETFTLYRTAFLDVDLEPRAADTIAALLAGRDLLIRDALPTKAEADDAVGQFAELIDYAREQEDEGEGQQMLNHLWSSPADLWRSGDRLTVGQVVALALAETEKGTHRKAIGALGLLVAGHDAYDARGPAPEHEPLFPLDREGHALPSRVVLVANRHDGLERIFAGTRWEKRAWVQAARHLPGGQRALIAGETPPRFAGARSRCTILFDPRWHPADPEPMDAQDAGAATDNGQPESPERWR